MSDDPLLPAYDHGCVSNVVPALLHTLEGDVSWVPPALLESERVVLLVLDGLGWNQLQARLHLTPTIAGLAGGAITTVAPSTTATALTSISTGLPPGEHGIMGYRIAVGTEVLNVLRWTTDGRDVRGSIIPGDLQPHAPFGGQRPPVLTRAEFAGSGFTLAHLEPVRFTGYRTLGTLTAELARLARAGEPLVYAYYEGLDKVSHEYGLGAPYEEELRWIDHLVATLLEVLPPGTALAITADHGQVETGDDVRDMPSDVLTHVAMQSGEGRFRWLHARGGRARPLADAAASLLSEHAWVRTRDEAIDEGWYGPKVTDAAAGRLGDVLVAAKGTVAFYDPRDTGPYILIGRHGSLTPDEMLVPFLAGVAG